MNRTRTCLLVLAVASGLVDAAGYLGIGRVFTANMTGNTVLLGVAFATGSGGDALRAVAALAGFCVGVAIGTALIPLSSAGWPRVARRALGFELLALTALLVAWLVVGVGPIRYGLIAASAIAMGAQSAAVRAAQAGGVATTYVTGTLTNAIARLITRVRTRGRQGEDPALGGEVWAVYAIGAVAGAFAEKAWHAWAIAPALAMVAAVAFAAGRR